MSGFLIAKEGPLAGLIIRMEEGNEWVIGRDPNVCSQLIEDPMVSRKHAILRLIDQEFQIENLSAINPVNLNGKSLTDPQILKEGDIVQIGNVFFRFSNHDPVNIPSEEEIEEIENATPTIYEDTDDLEALAFTGGSDTRWIIKIISGPNAGAEFGIHEATNYIIGKDPSSCDIILQDLSVSRQHAKISALLDGSIAIEDLGSLNKILVNGSEITEKTDLKTQDLISLGTTTFLLIDREQTRETIVSPRHPPFEAFSSPSKQKEPPLEDDEKKVMKKDWKKMKIPMRHLVISALFALLLIVAIGSVFSLFKSKSIIVSVVDESAEVKKALKNFPEIEFSFNTATGKLFLMGHVLTEVDHQEMVYTIRSLPFIQSIDNNVIIDELVWENTNALLSRNPKWRGINLTSIFPGRFVLRGYVQTLEEATLLAEYINLNFPYLDKLDNQVVVENTLEARIQSMLLEKNFENVTFQFSNGELILSGRVGNNYESPFTQLVSELRKITGIRIVKNFVFFTKPTNDIIDLTSKYKVTGSSMMGNVSQYVVINGKILTMGDWLDGMEIKKIEEKSIFLEKDGIKYQITYNQQ